MVSSFIHELKETLQSGVLPGERAHAYVMSERFPSNKYTDKIESAKESAVLIHLYIKEDRLFTNLILRPEYNGHHSGQVSLPGGKREAGDISLTHTAYREAEEEISLDSNKLELLGSLSRLYIPPSDFLVYPYIAFQNEAPSFKAEPKEVKSIYEVPISSLIQNYDYVDTRIRIGDLNRKVKGFYIEGQLVWGATAMIMREFLEIIKPLKSTSGLK